MRLTPYTLAVLITLASLQHPAAAQSPDEASQLLHEAILVETVQGDLERAKNLYDRIVRNYPGQSTIAAEALFRSARCRELLGDPEAELFYRRLISEFSNEAAFVRSARARLEALTASSGAVPDGPSPFVRPVVRDVARLPWWKMVTAVGPDGRSLVYVDARDGDLYVQDTLDADGRSITRERGLLPGGPGSHAIAARFSPDGTRLVYNWHDGEGGVTLHVSPVEPGRSPSLMWHPDYAYVHPLQFGPGGELLLFASRSGNENYELLKTVAGAWDTVVLHRMMGGPPLSAVMREGSQQVLFDQAEEEREYYGDVFGTGPSVTDYVQLYGSSPHDYLLGRSESLDGMFIHSFMGTVPTIYFVETPEDAEVWNFGEPLLYLRSSMFPFGFSDDGALNAVTYQGADPVWLLEDFWGLPAVYISRWAEYRAPQEFGQQMPFHRPVPILAHSKEGTILWALRNRSHVLEITGTEGRGPHRRMVQFLSGPEVAMRWSPEGRFLAYLIPALPMSWPGSGPILYVYDTLSSESRRRQFPVGSQVRLLCWSPDGEGVLVQRRDASGTVLLVVEPDAADASPFPKQGGPPLSLAGYSPRGTLVGVTEVGTEGHSIVEIPRGDGGVRPIHRTDWRIPLLRSRSGSPELVWVEYDPSGTEEGITWHLRVRVEGEEQPRVLLEGHGRLPMDLIWGEAGDRVGLVTDDADTWVTMPEGLSLIWVDLDGNILDPDRLAVSDATSAALFDARQTAVIRVRDGFGATWIRLENLEESARASLNSAIGGPGPNR